MWNRCQQWIWTIRYLKPIQLWYQLYYPIKKKCIRYQTKTSYQPSGKIQSQIPFLFYPESRPQSLTFNFLQKEKTFTNQVNWQFADYGKLWLYNMHYFDFILAKETTEDTARQWIAEYIPEITQNKVAQEPYPTSVRIINWIKACKRFGWMDQDIDQSILAQCRWLMRIPEWHILGNHLLENGFAIIMTGLYLEDESVYKHGEQIVLRELDRQVLQDGAHAELSPTYHLHVLHRVLDLIHLASCQKHKYHEVLVVLEKKASVMLAWAAHVCFADGSMPMVNDAYPDYFPGWKDVKAYAQTLGIHYNKNQLSDSGYRKICAGDFEMLIDAGPIGLSYQPGHGHADALQFVLQWQQKWILVDTGTSTYESDEIRNYERSTAAHNTVVVQQRNSSDVWKSFRVGRRAQVEIVQESERSITARHDGYQSLDVIHTRYWNWEDDSIKIEDNISGGDIQTCTAYFHFHPEVHVQKYSQTEVGLNKQVRLSFEGAKDIRIITYSFAKKFNLTQDALVAEVDFAEKLVSTIWRQ